MTNDQSTYLVDTNVLGYAWDERDPVKRDRAEEVLQALSSTEKAVVSVQILGEFFNTVTRKFPEPMTVAEAQERIEDLVSAMAVRPLTVETVLEAVKGVRLNHMSYWDALVWATAKLNDIPIVLTEDIQSSGAIEGVRFVNPFEPSFDVTSLTS